MKNKSESCLSTVLIMAWGAIRNRAPVPLLSQKTQIPCQDKSNLEDSFLVAPVISNWKWMQGFLTSVDQFEKNNLVSVKKIYSGSSFLSGIYELTPQHQCLSKASGSLLQHSCSAWQRGQATPAKTARCYFSSVFFSLSSLSREN